MTGENVNPEDVVEILHSDNLHDAIYKDGFRRRTCGKCDKVFEGWWSGLGLPRHKCVQPDEYDPPGYTPPLFET